VLGAGRLLLRKHAGELLRAVEMGGGV